MSCLKQCPDSVSTVISQQLVPQKAAIGVRVLRIIQKNSKYRKGGGCV